MGKPPVPLYTADRANIELKTKNGEDQSNKLTWVADYSDKADMEHF